MVTRTPGVGSDTTVGDDDDDTQDGGGDDSGGTTITTGGGAFSRDGPTRKAPPPRTDMGEPDVADGMDRDMGAQDRDTRAAQRREVTRVGAAQEARQQQGVERFEVALREQGRDVDLQARDVAVTEAGRVELTEAGRRRVRTDDLSRIIRELEGRTGIDVPGTGPVARERDLDRQFGDVTDIDDVLARAMREVEEFIEPEEGAFAEQFTEEEVQPDPETARRRELASEFIERGVEAPATLPTGGAAALVNVGEFAVREAGAVGRGDVDQIVEDFENVEDAVVNAAVGVGEQAAEDPGKFAAGGAGTLAGSAFLFGGAAAVGPRTSLATRAVVQPGEEALGIGGFRATKAVAGERTAQRFFPGKEPLIFSEEAFLRGVSSGAKRIRSEVEATEVQPRAGAGIVPPRIKRTETETEFDDTIEEALERMEEARIREFERSDRFGAGPTGIRTEPTVRRRERVVTEPEVEFDTEIAREVDRRVETTVGPVVDQQVTGQVDLGLEQETRQVQDPDIDTEIEEFMGRDVETETETEQEQRQELDLLTETEQELEQELEAELEAERELEAEVEPFDLEFGRRRERFEPLELDLFEQEFAFERDLDFFAEVEANLDV